MKNDNQSAVKSFKFNSDIKLFDLDKIPVIGNFRNQAVIGLDNDGLSFISKIKSGPIDLGCLTEKENQLLAALKDNGYFDPDVADSLTSAYVHVTDKCNLHCVGCYSFIKDRNQKEDLSTEQMKYIFKKLVDCGVNSIVVSGGEPFLRNDLDEILRYAKQTLKLKNLHIISNGTMSHEKYDKCLPYIDNISISIDGYSPDVSFIRDKGIMPKVFETIHYLKSKVNLCLIATLHKKTSPIIDRYLDLSKQLCVPLSFSVLTLDYFDPVFKDYVLDDDDFENVNQFMMKNRGINIQDSMLGSIDILAKKCCNIGKFLVSIGATGEIYPCFMLHRKELVMGNILTDDLNEVLNSEKNPCKHITVDDLIECSECEYKYICGGGCRASSYYMYRDFLHPEVSCKKSKQYLKNVVDNMKLALHMD